MIPIVVKIISYDFLRNICSAKLQNGNIIELDPFVSCAIELSDDDYNAGKGSKIVGKTYILTRYTVYRDCVVAHENGMIED